MTPVTRTHRTVIVGVDGSEQSLAAVALGAVEAAHRHEPLRLIWAYLWPLYASAVHMPGATGFDEPLAAPTDQLEAIAARTRETHPGLEVSTAVVVGAAANILIGESIDASLLVVGSRGRGGFAGLLTGSVATQVATHAHCPVIVVRHGAEPAPGHPVIVGVDGVEHTRDAVAFAFAEAAARGVSITAVHAWAPPPPGEPNPFKPVAYDYDEAHREASRILAEALAGYQELYPGVEVFREVLCSVNPARELLRVSGEADLLVVGSRGYGGFAGLLLGSVGQALIQHAQCPVAVVRTAA